MSRGGSSTVTHHRAAALRVNVRPQYIPNLQIAGGFPHCFAYAVSISNIGEIPIRLLSRRWEIFDGDNKTREVVGDGVIGKQPRLLPGEEFQYTSYVDLPTPVGCMRGGYRMATDDGDEFDATIGVFSLVAPGALNS